VTPLFTIHAGECLVGNYIERHFRNRMNVWIPSKDTGIDLLVSDRRNRHTASLQVKFGKDFLPEMAADLQGLLRVYSWFTINTDKLRTSQADFWVFVLSGFKRRSPDFVVVPTTELQSRLGQIHGLKKNKIQSYLCVAESNQCWEARDLTDRKKDERLIAAGKYEENPHRDFTKFLNDDGWNAPVKKLSR
jgi:hypothetical protein